MWRRILLVLFAAATAVAAADLRPSRQAGLPFVQVYGPNDYDEHGQNWAITQDRDGVLYIGNNNGVILAYDGHEWRSHRVAGPGAPVRGLAFDENGRLWFGASGDLGYLDSDGRGGLVCTSLLKHVPEEVRANFLMYHVVHRPDGVFFFTGHHVLRWHDGKFDIEKIRLAWPSQPGGRLLRHGADRPLEEWRDGAWRTLADAPELRRLITRFSTKLPDGALLLATNRGGFFRLDDAGLTPWPTEIDEFLKSAGVERGLRLRDGSLVLSHRPKGISILDAAGRLRHYFSEENSPLPTPIAWAFFQDRHDDLWVMLDTGIARIARPGAVTVFGQGLGRSSPTEIMTFSPYRDRLHVGTTHGLWRLVESTPAAVPPRPAHFERVPGIESTLWTLFNTPEELLVGHQLGLACFRDDSPLKPVIESTTARTLWISRADPRHALVGIANNVRQLRRDPEGWRDVGPIPGIEAEARKFLEDADGALWASVFNAGYSRMIGVPGTGSADGQPVRVEHYPGGYGFATERFAGSALMGRFDGRVRFLDGSRMFHFDPASRRFVDDGDITERLGVPGATVTRFFSDHADNLWIYLLRPDAAGWPAKGRQAFLLQCDGQRRIVPYWLTNYVGPNVAAQYMVGGDRRPSLWLLGSDGIARVELPDGLPEPTPFRAFLRRAEDAGGHALPLALAATLPYAQRAVELTLATDRFGDSHIVFQSRLDNEPWSAWSASPRFAFARLGIGPHTMQLRARDADGVVTEPVRFAARVLPPWWLAWWAWFGYALATAGCLAGIVRWRLRALRRRNEELEQLVATRTTELSARKDELSRALASAEDANRTKTVFLAHMSHELRTPLNAIIGFAQILQRDTSLSVEQQRRLSIIGRNGEHLLQMINEVLDLSKIEAGRLVPVSRPVHLPQLIAGVADTFAQRAADKGLEFRREIAADLPTNVLADETRLRQVLVNLLGNAVKFTATGHVGLRVQRMAPDSVRVRFACFDTGPGLDAADRAALFEPFRQGAAGRAEGAGGTGLGLAISQRLVTAMGGSISVDTARERGSCFVFELALPPAAEPARAPRNGAQITGYTGARRRLLVVDDEESNREVLRTLLAPLGFAIEECADGRACVDAFRRQPADAVLLDLRMPGELDGFAAARALRSLPDGKAPAIIAVSASVFEEERQTALDAGCDVFVPKPFSEERLFNALGECLDLTWVLQTRPTEPSAPSATLPAAEAEKLRDLARRGDIKAFRDHLRAIEATAPECAALLAHLDALAAGFQLGRLRQELRATRTGHSPTPP